MSDSRYNTRPRTSPLRLYFGPLLHVAQVAIVRTVTPNRSAAWARVYIFSGIDVWHVIPST